MERKQSFREALTGTVTDTFFRGQVARAYGHPAQPASAEGTSAFPVPRLSLRRHIPLEALINFGLTYSAAQHVRDLSTTGAFVELDATEFTEGTTVEFVLRYLYKGEPIELRLPATVTRATPGGAALRFGKYDDATYTNLVNLLYAL